MIDIDYYTKRYNFLNTPVVGIQPAEGQALVLVARKGPFMAMVERAEGETIWTGRLFFGMPDKDGLAGSPTVLGVVLPHHQISVVLLRLVQRAHEVKRATMAACQREKRNKHDYRTPKKRA
jgi:hypothetical protein